MKNGPARREASHGAEAVRDAITHTIITLPEELRRSLTWDQGAEMAPAREASLSTRACRSTSVILIARGSAAPMRIPTDCYANTSPKALISSMHSADEIAAVAATLNARPRKTLAWRTPAEAFDRLL